MGEETCPVPCACLEVACCPGAAVFANSLVIRERYNLGLDADDIRLIRLNNLLQCCACICSCIACLTDNEAIDQAANIVEWLADAVFCCTAGCMTAQVYHEINLREASAPQASKMQR